MLNTPRKKNFGKIYIGNNNVINEYSNIHRPTSYKKKTIIGNNNYIMNSFQQLIMIVIRRTILCLAANVILGGNVYIMNGAQLGIRNQLFIKIGVIGSYTMIGMGSIITKKKSFTRIYLFLVNQ